MPDIVIVRRAAAAGGETLAAGAGGVLGPKLAWAGAIGYFGEELLARK